MEDKPLDKKIMFHLTFSLPKLNEESKGEMFVLRTEYDEPKSRKRHKTQLREVYMMNIKRTY